MVRKRILFILLLCLGLLPGKAQISHGGSPLPASNLRSLDANLFIEMPAFNVAEELRLDSLNESDLRSGYRFAYKFMTSYTRGNSGISFILPDGTRVWQLGIRSAGALSINILFSEYELPEGAQVFLYNTKRTQVLGAFNQLNNSELGLLPVSPVQGDELIIEYREPAGAAFPGRLTVGEVNHAYRSLRGREPQADKVDFKCIPPLACNPGTDGLYETIGRSTVMLIIDGSIACSGTLINNTAGDGKPYLLTASHCLNNQFTITSPDYEKVAGSIVCFFNYDSPLCSQTLRGAEEMSVASAHCRAVFEQTDMALLELLETPPVYYQPYYAGWNAQDEGTAPYAGIHHPGGTVKRINITNNPLSLSTLNTTNANFLPDAHWRVDRWESGTTAGGSSGSALFDSAGRIVGALSGGSSTCSNPVNDFYYALAATWTPSEKPEEQLKYWLNPLKENPSKRCDGLDPYASEPCYRLSNTELSGNRESIETTQLAAPASGFLFGNNSLRTRLYLEEYKTNGKATLHGAYLVSNATQKGTANPSVEIVVYTGTNQPLHLIHTEPFQPTYTNKVVFDNTFQETDKPLNRAQESYVGFSKGIEIEGTFYIGYKVTAQDGDTFEAFNLPKGKATQNTTWLYYDEQWIKASEHPVMPFPTSLFVDPVIRYAHFVSNETIKTDPDVQLFLSAGSKTIHILLPATTRQATFTLLTIDGQRIQKNRIAGNSATLPSAVTAPGIYVAHLVYDNKEYTRKLIF